MVIWRWVSSERNHSPIPSAPTQSGAPRQTHAVSAMPEALSGRLRSIGDEDHGKDQAQPDVCDSSGPDGDCLQDVH
jgi:hypothetical protein